MTVPGATPQSGPVHHRRSILRCISVAATLWIAALWFPASARDLDATQNRASENSRPLQVLFIGDSYIYVNNVADMLKGIAAGLGGPAIEPTMAASGGVPLGWHLANGPALMLLAERQWDYVVMQEHSLLGGFVIDGEPRIVPPRIFHSSARELVRHIRERSPQAQPLFFMTWARRGRPQEEPILTNAYLDIGKELGVPVAPIGLAWEETKRRHPDVDLFARDGAHPSPAGTYLAAAILYASITGRSPQGAPPRIEGHPWSRQAGGIDMTRTVTLADLAPEVATRLQEVASDITGRRANP
jgi:hypothetical protein